MRVVSLVPSLTDAAAQLGAGDDLVGVTDWCAEGAPPGTARIGGTKNPDVDAVIDLRPDLVLANTEENRPADLEALRAAGLAVHEAFPRAVAHVAPMLVDLAAALGRPGAGDAAAAAVEQARAAALARRPRTPIAACTLVWRRPWMGLGPDTFADDLLACCGFANVLVGSEERYPRLDPAVLLRPEVVLLPSEPYAFAEDDVPAVRELLGDAPHRFVDGQLLTWHGPRTAEALAVFSALAGELDAAR